MDSHETYEEGLFSKTYGLYRIRTYDHPSLLNLFKHPIDQLVASKPHCKSNLQESEECQIPDFLFRIYS